MRAAALRRRRLIPRPDAVPTPKDDWRLQTVPLSSPWAIETDSPLGGATMIRTGEQYRASIRDGRETFINGERVNDVTVHPMFRPLVDVRARIYAPHWPSSRRPPVCPTG
jgi:hypothetical protein